MKHLHSFSDGNDDDIFQEICCDTNRKNVRNCVSAGVLVMKQHSKAQVLKCVLGQKNTNKYTVQLAVFKGN